MRAALLFAFGAAASALQAPLPAHGSAVSVSAAGGAAAAPPAAAAASVEVALCQLAVTADRAANIGGARRSIAEAAAGGAELVRGPPLPHQRQKSRQP